MTTVLTHEQKSWLVREAEKIADKIGRQRNQASQMRNMIKIAGEEAEIPVLVNFINYQAARWATKNFWRPIRGDVVALLKEIGNRHPEAKSRQDAICHLFGYMVRRYVYLDGLVYREQRRKR